MFSDIIEVVEKSGPSLNSHEDQPNYSQKQTNNMYKERSWSPDYVEIMNGRTGWGRVSSQEDFIEELIDREVFW